MTTFLTQNNKAIAYDELKNQISINSVHHSEVHFSTCFELANKILRKDESTNQVKVLTNLLFAKSKKAYLISLLSFYNTRADDKIVKVFHPFDDISAEILHERGIAVEKNGKIEASFLDARLIPLLIKLIIHKLFRLHFFVFSSFKTDKKNLIRSWVEVSYTLYKDKYPESVILVYPFGLSLDRQKRYFKMLKANKFEYLLIGVPYSFRNYVALLLSNKHNRDLKILAFEYDAYQTHSAELGRFNATQIYTTDEFEAAGLVLYESLISNKVNVQNRAHGIGQYCPIVNYSDFVLYNQTQIDYYRRNNKNINYLIDSGLKPAIEPVNLGVGAQKCIVYLHMDAEVLNLMFEADRQVEILKQLKIYSDEKGIKCIVKIHPNTSEKETERLNNQFQIPCVRSITDIINSYSPVFVHLLSTAYFDFFKLGNFYFYTDRYYNPKDYFGDDIFTFSLENLSETLDTEFGI